MKFSLENNGDGRVRVIAENGAGRHVCLVVEIKNDTGRHILEQMINSQNNLYNLRRLPHTVSRDV